MIYTLVHKNFISDFQVTDMEYEANVQYATENSNLPANVAINLTQDQSRAKNDRDHPFKTSANFYDF